MGIYNDGKIYGVRWYRYAADERKIRNIVEDPSAYSVGLPEEYDQLIVDTFERTYSEQMTMIQIQEVKAQYDLIADIENQEPLYVKFYTKCSDTYGAGEYMHWWSGNMDQLKELFLTGDARI